MPCYSASGNYEHIVMRSVKWRWCLSIALLVLTVACQIYSGHQFRVARAGLFSRASFQWPPFPDRLMRFVSFPALALAGQLVHFDSAFFDYQFFHYSGWGFVGSAERTCFLCRRVSLVVCGRRQARPASRVASPPWNRTVRLAALAGGVGLGVLTALHADHLLADRALAAAKSALAAYSGRASCSRGWSPGSGEKRAADGVERRCCEWRRVACSWLRRFGSAARRTDPCVGRYLRPSAVRLVQPPVVVRSFRPPRKRRRV